MNSRIEEFRTGIFELRTRRFGKVAELLIKKKYNMRESTSNAYDLVISETGEKVEVKFSTVMRAHTESINEENLIDQCIKANISNRALTFDELTVEKFDCNIQQVKRKEFDILYYGMFLLDKIAVFKVRTDHIFSTLGYSDFQHRGNEGEGQFHINNQTLDYHLNNNFVTFITYEEMYMMFSE